MLINIYFVIINIDLNKNPQNPQPGLKTIIYNVDISKHRKQVTVTNHIHVNLYMKNNRVFSKYLKCFIEKHYKTGYF